VVDAGNAAGPALFAINELTVVVPADSTTVTSFSDLAEPGLLLVLAAPEVPAGNFAREALEKAAALPGYGDDFAERVLENLVSNETDVRAVLTKVQLGEADAGIVYVTDVAAAGGEVTAIEIPSEANVRAAYPMVALSDAANPAGAQAFVTFVLSQEGRQILERHGFGTP
jgi:molybdate transport system substrate-binding protein